MATKKLSVSATKLSAAASAAKVPAVASKSAVAPKLTVAAPAAQRVGTIKITTPVATAPTKIPTPVATPSSPAGIGVQPNAPGKVGIDLGAGAGVGVGTVFNPGTVVNAPPVSIIPTEFSKQIVRPRDLLVLDFTFVNLHVAKDNNGGLQLVRNQTTAAAYVVVGFPSQHLLEEAFFEKAAEVQTQAPAGKPADLDAGLGTDDPTTADLPVASRLSDTSRLVFRVPANFTNLPYTLDAVLNACREYELSVSPSATPPDPRFVFFPGLVDVVLSKLVLTSPSISLAAKVTVKSTPISGLSAVAKLAASQALTATTIAEARNQWYSKRSPLLKAAVDQNEIGLVTAGIDAIKILPKLAPPVATETSIEAPARLVLSPNSYGAWVHATEPVESAQSGRVELWHTRLAVRTSSGVTEANDFRRTVRAIWSPDVNIDPFNIPPHSNSPFRAPLDALDRHNIVHLSGNHQVFLPGSRTNRHKPVPIEVERLMLSSLGVWMNVRGAWNPPPSLSVEEWLNRSTLGRDHYVRVVYAGRLYPFGHRASLVKVTERKFQPGVKGNAAVLRQRMFIVVREPYLLQGNSGAWDAAGKSLDLSMPLKSARITTLVTPNLDKPELHPSSVVKTSPEATGPNPHLQSLFWPYVNGQPFPFHVQFEDESGVLINSTAPLFFVGNEKLDPATGLIPMSLATDLAARYSTYAPFKALRRLNFSGQRVQFAATAKPGDTSFEVNQMEFMLTANAGRLIPGMASATTSIPALKHLARSQVQPELKFPDRYLKGGFATSGANKNPGEVFLELLDANSTKLDFSSQGDRSGGFLAPNVAISGLSRSLGPVGGTLDTIATGSFKPADFFNNLGDLLPKLFGCIKITDILSDLGLGDLTKLPRFISENLTAAEGLLDDLKRVQDYLSNLQGQLGGLNANATTLATAAATMVSALGNLLGDPLDGAKRDAFKNGFIALSTAGKDLRSGFGGLTVPENLQFTKTQLDQLLGKFTAGLEQVADVVVMADRIADTLEALNEQRIKFEWKPPISSWPKTDPIFEVLPDGGLVISVELAAQSGASKEPSLDIACRLQKFDLNLIAPASFLKLHFNKIEFTASSHSKPDVNVDFGGIEFVGVLSFVETLRTLIPLDGFSDPPSLSVTEQGIEASFSLSLPNIAVGVFSLSNLSLGAALTVPFVGQQPLSVRFNFCERSDPFRLTVWIFGGGGFFAVTVTPAGVQILEASFEFGAAVALDFGVASGSVSVMAGIYFKIEGDDASLTGYFNVKGRVSVLGLIHASLELNLELSYEFSSGKCVGRASLIIEVEVLFFSASVEVKCEKKFAGSNGDPSFVQIMSPYTDPDSGDEVDPWPEYCEAFAA